jgi:hypothetical protein
MSVRPDRVVPPTSLARRLVKRQRTGSLGRYRSHKHDTKHPSALAGSVRIDELLRCVPLSRWHQRQAVPADRAAAHRRVFAKVPQRLTLPLNEVADAALEIAHSVVLQFAADGNHLCASVASNFAGAPPCFPLALLPNVLVTAPPPWRAVSYVKRGEVYLLQWWAFALNRPLGACGRAGACRSQPGRWPPLAQQHALTRARVPPQRSEPNASSAWAPRGRWRTTSTCASSSSKARRGPC